MQNQIELTAQDQLTMDIVESGVVTWDDLLRTVKQFHYGRNENRENLELVWTERKGTCSSKHAFLKHVADLNQLTGIELVLCIYKMNALNTSGIGGTLKDSSLSYIPEAHCYLKTPEGDVDVTSMNANLDLIREDILEEQFIDAEQVGEYKVAYHKRFIENWATMNSKLTLDEVWELREKCILALEV